MLWRLNLKGFKWGGDSFKRGDFKALIDTLPRVIPVIDKRGVQSWELAESWKVYLVSDKTAFFIIPAGSKTNFGTIPWFFRWLVSPLDPVIAMPSIVHDYLVSEFGKEKDYLEPKYAMVIKNGSIDTTTVFRSGYEWVDSALLFRKLALAFSGNEARFKANLAFIFIIIRGIFKNYI